MCVPAEAGLTPELGLFADQNTILCEQYFKKNELILVVLVNNK